MYCPHCGKDLALSANFCSACGGAVAFQPINATQSRIVRPRYPRMIAGVCSGFAQHFGWDLTLVRVLLVVFTILTSGLGLLCYLGAWIILPEALYALPYNAGYPPPPTPNQTQQGTSA
jgi:phage shock protein C